MADRQLTISLPETTIAELESRTDDVQAFIVHAIDDQIAAYTRSDTAAGSAETGTVEKRRLVMTPYEREVFARLTPEETEFEQWGQVGLTLAEKEAILHRMLPPARLESGLDLLHRGEIIPGLMGGTVWMSEDFDDEMPDEEWGDLFR